MHEQSSHCYGIVKKLVLHCSSSSQGEICIIVKGTHMLFTWKSSIHSSYAPSLEFVSKGYQSSTKGLFILGPNRWAQFKATNTDEWECPVDQIGPSLGPKGFILRPVPIFPCLT